MLVDDNTNTSVEKGERNDGQNEGNGEDAHRVRLAQIKGVNGKDGPIFGALRVRFILKYDGRYLADNESRRGNENGQYPNGDYDSLCVASFG